MAVAPAGQLSVGDLSRRTGLSSKALRHYDRIGLFRPACVDGSGYRWYEPGQQAQALLIARLRAVDVPLDDVRRCLDDPALAPDVLKAHRLRLEARLARVQRQLHRLDHLSAEGADTMEEATTSAITAEDERAIAAQLFNGTWTLMEQEDRSRDEDDRMLHMAHASRYHWGNVGRPENLARGEWICSRVYAVLGRPEPCLYHAQRVLDICTEHGIGDFDRAFAFEALARACAVGGDAEAARSYTEQALGAAEDIADAEDRELLLSDLESIPNQRPVDRDAEAGL